MEVAGGNMAFEGGWWAPRGGGLRSLAVDVLVLGDAERVIADTGRRWYVVVVDIQRASRRTRTGVEERRWGYGRVALGSGKGGGRG